MWGTIAIGTLLIIFVFNASMPYYLQPAEAEFLTKNLSINKGFSSDPKMAVSDNNVYVTWEDFTPNNWDVFFSASRDNGASFGNAINLSNNAAESGRPQIAVSGNNVYVVWQDFTSKNYDIFFRASNDNGVSFSDVINLSNNAGNLPDPKRSDPSHIAAAGSNVYVTWVYSGDMFFRVSKDSGTSFGDVVKLNSNATVAGNFLRPHLAVSSSNVYLVWVYNNDIFFRASNDNGISFSDAINLSADSKNATDPNRSDLPDIAVSSDNVYVVWVDYTPGNYDIFFRMSNDGGTSFSDVIELSTIATLSDLPHIAVSGSNVYVVWEDYNLAEGLDMFLRVSSDNGNSFSNAINLSRNTGYSASTPIAVSGSNVYVVSSVGNVDIFFKTSKDNGASFSSAVNLSNNHGGSSDPNIAVSGDNVFVVWEDYAFGHPDIFFMSFIPSDYVEAGETMLLSTENGSMNIEVTMDRGTITTDAPVKFTLKFVEPITGEPIQHVNYSFTIKDEDGNIVVNKPNMQANQSVDTQSVTFPNTGSFTLVIDVIGLGMIEPYDTRYSGAASALLTVVPEFPLSILAVMAVIVGLVTVITRFRNPLSR